jgi:multidrug resistance efflux pump
MAKQRQEDIEDIEIRSEEVQEILGTPPPWLVRYGTLMVFVLFVTLGWMSFWIKWPEVVDDDIQISFKEPPYRLIAQQGNYIQKVLVKNNRIVKENEVLIIFRNNADYNEVLSLEDKILSLKKFDDSTLLTFEPSRDLPIGDLQEDLFKFLDSKNLYIQSMLGRYESSEPNNLRKQIANTERIISLQQQVTTTLSKQIEDAQVDLRNAEHRVKVDQISQDDANKSRNRLEDLKKDLLDQEAVIKARQSEITTMRARIGEAESGAVRNVKEAANECKDSFFRLRARLETWKKNYLLVSPGAGTVQIVGNNVSEGLFVKEGDELIAVIPASGQKMVGRMNIPFIGSGKVKAHQKVIIKLENLPFQEYGTIQGEVLWKSRVTHSENQKLVVPVEIDFPLGVVTSTGKSPDNNEELVGMARIITEEKRFIERVFQKVRAIN